MTTRPTPTYTHTCTQTHTYIYIYTLLWETKLIGILMKTILIDYITFQSLNFQFLWNWVQHMIKYDSSFSGKLQLFKIVLNNNSINGMEKLQILIGDALEAKDILGISFLWKDLIKCMPEFFFFFYSIYLALCLQNFAIIKFFLKRNILYCCLHSVFSLFLFFVGLRQHF